MSLNRGLATLATHYQQDRTVIGQQYSCAPLQWLGPIDPAAPRPVMYIRNPNGGLVAGDQHQIRLHLGSHTHLEIRSQSATRLHPGLTHQDIHIVLEADSSLIWVAHPLIPGADAQIQQRVTVQMAKGSRLAYGEIWTAGRIGMGETWRFQELRSQVRITQEDRLVVAEQVYWRGGHPSISAPGVLGPFTCWGSLYLLGDWPPVVWPQTPAQSEQQWYVERPHGRILRSVGTHSSSLWERFQSCCRHLDTPRGASPQEEAIRQGYQRATHAAGLSPRSESS